MTTGGAPGGKTNTSVGALLPPWWGSRQFYVFALSPVVRAAVSLVGLRRVVGIQVFSFPLILGVRMTTPKLFASYSRNQNSSPTFLIY